MGAIKSTTSASGPQEIGDRNFMVRAADIVTVMLTEAGFIELYLRNNGRVTVTEPFGWFFERFRDDGDLPGWFVLKLAPEEHQ